MRLLLAVGGDDPDPPATADDAGRATSIARRSRTLRRPAGRGAGDGAARHARGARLRPADPARRAAAAGARQLPLAGGRGARLLQGRHRLRRAARLGARARRPHLLPLLRRRRHPRAPAGDPRHSRRPRLPPGPHRRVARRRRLPGRPHRRRGRGGRLDVRHRHRAAAVDGGGGGDPPGAGRLGAARDHPAPGAAGRAPPATASTPWAPRAASPT